MVPVNISKDGGAEVRDHLNQGPAATQEHIVLDKDVLGAKWRLGIMATDFNML